VSMARWLAWAEAWGKASDFSNQLFPADLARFVYIFASDHSVMAERRPSPERSLWRENEFRRCASLPISSFPNFSPTSG